MTDTVLSPDLKPAITKPPKEEGWEKLVTRDKDGDNQLIVGVKGAHCAGCIQRIEQAVEALAAPYDTTIKARLNFSTERLTVRWQGTPDAANHMADAILALGYQLLPLSDTPQTNDAVMRQLILSLGVAGFAAGNIMLISVGVWAATEETMGMATRTFMNLIAAIIAVPTVLFAGRPFFQSAWGALKARHTNMDVPISLALILALSMSLLELATGGAHVYFDSCIMLIFFLLIGRTLDHRARNQARSSARDLMKSLTGFATEITLKGTSRLPISAVRPNMRLLVGRGEKFPADGLLESDIASVNTALITGESLPQSLKKGERVFAGTINLGNAVEITAGKVGDDSVLGDIVRLVEEGEAARSKYTRLADKAAQWYTPLVHSAALIAFLFWWLVLGEAWQPSLMVGITVLIITCPCALGLAVPVVQVLAVTGLLKRGILSKSGDALERLAGIDHIVFDKTGTLTKGALTLVNKPDPEALALAAGLAKSSRHPISEALVDANRLTSPNFTDVNEIDGAGLTGELEGIPCRLGSRSFVGLDTDASLQPATGPEVWFKKGDDTPIVFRFADQLHQDATSALEDLQKHGLTISLLSGDQQSTVDAIAETLGINDARGVLKPDEKFEIVKAMKNQGHRIMMVGDGLNDTPTLAAAHVSMSPGSAIDMAQASADIVYQDGGLSSIPLTVRIAKATRKLIIQNFWLAGLYNLIAIPLAFAGLVTPLMAALAMSFSSIVVIANSFRLRLMA